VGPLAWCIGRVLVGIEGSQGYCVVFSLGVFGMSVEIAVYFVGTGVFLTGVVSSDLNFR
jgi:hypothetical protein